MDFDYYPFDEKDIRIVLCDTKVHHSLASSEYNVRRRQCEDGVSTLKKFDESIQSLRDVSLDFLRSRIKSLDEIVYKRCEFVIEENDRLLEACVNLQNQDLKSFGEKMYQSHFGLRDKYEVSCAELDFLVELTSDFEGIFGSRMMGGGFGGCTINLIQVDAIDDFTLSVSKEYEKKFGKRPEFYITQIVGGTSFIHD